ncbi:NifB/NifX family molybdenum-iron cluster-binding protein [Caloranaerobacter sp. DY30410]|uniref:NifB/NifX family molybdenum-iron cluster-binding protein n=1 Tax=Caloranaerobacter sp. DY30410 TaxID=3238305 RepID=UPI003D0204AA
MKVCFSSAGKNLDSQLDPRFGRCKYFIIVNIETDEFKVVENEGFVSEHGAGVSAANLVVDEGVDIVITRNIGPNSMKILTSAKISVYEGQPDTIKANLELLKQDKLNEIKEPRKSHFGLQNRWGR